MKTALPLLLAAFACLLGCKTTEVAHTQDQEVVADLPGQDLPARQLPADEEAAVVRSIQRSRQFSGANKAFFEGGQIAPAALPGIMDTLNPGAYAVDIEHDAVSGIRIVTITRR
ncbi:MAG: hypothetical protein WBA12_12555 [Catalinimonas sp.]